MAIAYHNNGNTPFLLSWTNTPAGPSPWPVLITYTHKQKHITHPWVLSIVTVLLLWSVITVTVAWLLHSTHKNTHTHTPAQKHEIRWIGTQCHHICHHFHPQPLELSLDLKMREQSQKDHGTYTSVHASTVCMFLAAAVAVCMFVCVFMHVWLYNCVPKLISTLQGFIRRRKEDICFPWKPAITHSSPIFLLALTKWPAAWRRNPQRVLSLNTCTYSNHRTTPLKTRAANRFTDNSEKPCHRLGWGSSHY